MNDFLLGDVLGPYATAPNSDMFGGNPDLTVIQAIDRAAATIGERFRDQPLVEAAIRMVIGQGYQRLAKYQLAARPPRAGSQTADGPARPGGPRYPRQYEQPR